MITTEIILGATMNSQDLHIEKNHIKEAQLFSHASTYILWVHNLDTEIFWIKLNSRK